MGNSEFEALKETENEAIEMEVFFSEIVNNRAYFVFREILSS